MNDFNSPRSDENIPVRRGRVGSVILYDVREDELDLLEKGGDGMAQLNFAIFLYSVAFASIVTLLTSSNFRWEIAKTFFIVAALIGLILGTYFMIMWRGSKKTVNETVSKIRNRLNGGSSDEQIPDDLENIENQPNIDSTDQDPPF